MINACVTFILIILFFLSGRIFEGIKRLLALILDIGLKILNLFGIQISRREIKLHTSRQFRNTFKDIKIVKKSRQNNKIKRSVNIFALIVLIITVAGVIINISSQGIISNFLFEHNPLPMLIQSQSNMEITFTALSFSIISFSISKLIAQWRATAEFRKAKRDIKLQGKILNKMSSKDLLDIAKQKDREAFNRISISSNKED